MDPRVAKMADVLVNYSVAVKRGDWVVIQSPLPGEPLVVACAAAVTRAGGHATVQFVSEDAQEAVLTLADDEQLRWVSPISRLVNETADALISIMAPRNTRAMAGIDPARLAISSKSREEILEMVMHRAAAGELHWTLAAYPTPAGAQDANMSLRAYEDFVYGAGLLEEDDPAEAWRRMGARQNEIIEWLNGRNTVRIVGPGTDLEVSVGGRTWITDTGKENFPGGEIFTGPNEDGTNGVIEFTFPAYLSGREVSGVRLVFDGGRVTEATARSDEAFLHEALAMDDGARRLGEFAFGMNPGIQRFTKNTLFDEKIGGTLHMALGRSYPETGGVNESALHWDMVYDMRDGGEVTVDGELFSRNGEFCV